ncbi:MAG: J domain-containing protein [Methylovirgula sp.]
MSIAPEHIAAIVCAFIGYGLVSAVLTFRTRRVAKKEEKAKSGSKAGAQSKSNTNSQNRPGTEKINQQWFDVLGVSPSAPMAEIKAAYRAKISGYHPDKVASLAEELRELAEERSKAINSAYATAMRLRQ